MSQANYIIICDGEIGVLGSKTASDMILAASLCASQLTRHIEVTCGGEVQPDDFKAVTDLQHEMMDNLKKYTKPKAQAKCKEMFILLRALEDKFQ